MTTTLVMILYGGETHLSINMNSVFDVVFVQQLLCIFNAGGDSMFMVRLLDYSFIWGNIM